MSSLFVETFRKKYPMDLYRLSSVYLIYNQQTCIKNTVSPVLQVLHSIPTSTRFLLVSLILSTLPRSFATSHGFFVPFPANNFGSQPSPNSIMDGKMIQLSHLKVTKQSKHMQAIQRESGIKLAVQNFFSVLHLSPSHGVPTDLQALLFLARVLSGLSTCTCHCSTLMIELFNYSIKFGGLLDIPKDYIKTCSQVGYKDTSCFCCYIITLKAIKCPKCPKLSKNQTNWISKHPNLFKNLSSFKNNALAAAP